MITNFETITKELNSDELNHVNCLATYLMAITKERPKKGHELVALLNVHARRHGIIKMTDVRLRKCVNYIRSNSIIPIIATSKGYYCSFDEKELSDQIISLTERANSIMDCVFGLQKILNKKTK